MSDSTADRSRAIVFSYTNHRGEGGFRTAVPIRLRWGTDEWYPEPCWLLDAFDLDRQAERTFALLKMGSIQGPKSDEPLTEVFARLREIGGGRWDEIDDVPAYLGRETPDPRGAELAALRAEVERLRAENDLLRRDAISAEARAQERAITEVERLIAAWPGDEDHTVYQGFGGVWYVRHAPLDEPQRFDEYSTREAAVRAAAGLDAPAPDPAAPPDPPTPV